MVPDNELIEACLRGEKKAQQQLYERFSPKMLVVSLRYSKALLDAEDILQESFIKIFHYLPQFRQDCPLEMWIKKIVVNTALKNNRSKLYQFPAEDVYEMHENLQEPEFTLSNYSFKELLAMIQKLPLGCQMVFNLYAIEGYQHNEIGEMLEISEGTSKSQYSRAKQLLQTMLTQNEREFYV